MVDPKPEVDFKLFISTLALEAKMSLESGSDSDAPDKAPNLGKAHYMLSILKIIQVKTLNNLEDDEAQLLQSLIDKIQEIYNLIENQETSL